MSSAEDDQQQNQEGDCPLEGFSSVKTFSTSALQRIVTATRAFQSLPSSGPAWDLQKSYPEFNRAMKNVRSRLVPMISSLLLHANLSPEEFRFGDMDEKFDFLVDANDDLLERVGHALDEASGHFKKPDTIVVGGPVARLPPGTWGKRKMMAEQGDDAQQESGTRKFAVATRKVREKPQLRFTTPVDNSPHTPFVPKLKEKPHSIKPLSILPEYTGRGNEEFYGHPYLIELNRWEPPDAFLEPSPPIPPKELPSTPLVHVTTEAELNHALLELSTSPELAVDVEHHSYRSFLGFTCLLQISTREKDYIFDTLSLRDHLHVLNNVFTDPKVLKVFHGGTMDIEWLQKDLGLYVVGMFDTMVGARLLALPQLSLQFLLDKYCGVSQNKTFQLADWRVRPLSEEMVHYARMDTHSLLYIKDCLRNGLLERGRSLLISCFEQSRSVCLKRYEKPLTNPTLALRKMRRTLNNRQVHAFTELWKWRDSVAREKDESIAYVLPTHMLLLISEQLPKEMTGVLACCDPTPPLLHPSLGHIHKIVQEARALPLQEQNTDEKIEKRQKQKAWVVVLDAVHDVDVRDVGDNEDGGDDNNMGVVQKEWPQEPPFGDVSAKPTPVKPSISLNKYVKPKRLPESGSSATPFERYQLSKEIMEMLSDPVKAAALDMENPVIRAVYETVFMQIGEEEETRGEGVGTEEPQKLDQAFQEGGFVPFNPIIGDDAGSQSKRRGRSAHKRKRDGWDDDPTPATAEERNGGGILTIDLSGDEGDSPTTSSTVSSTPLTPFMSVPQQQQQQQQSSSSKKKKKKKGNFMNKLRNPFSKKKGKYDVGEASSSTSKKGEESKQKNTPNKNNKNKRGNKGGGNKFFDFQKGGNKGRSVTF